MPDGDSGQLPSQEPGPIVQSICDSGCIPKSSGSHVVIVPVALALLGGSLLY